MRLNNVYDIDTRTYLLKFARSEEKAALVFQSGARIHLTEFAWPKNMMPSGFSMKCRKHLRNKRLVGIHQLGVDRVVDLEFGSGEACYHLVIEIYDRGNVVLADCNYTILHLLRPRKDTGAEVRFAIGETYRKDLLRQESHLPDRDDLQRLLSSEEEGKQVQRVLASHFEFGHILIGHCLIEEGFESGVKLGKGFNLGKDVDRVVRAIHKCDLIFRAVRSSGRKGIILQRDEKVPTLEGTATVQRNVEFHPMLFHQHEKLLFREFPSMNKEKEAVKKVANVEKDHKKRIERLQEVQAEDEHKAHLIELNIDLVDAACRNICSAIATGLAWEAIEAIVRDAQIRKDPVAMAIHKLKLKEGLITMALSDPYASEEEEEGKPSSLTLPPSPFIPPHPNPSLHHLPSPTLTTPPCM
jgi:predicted ribosome quality control (RQC) complex YloA/Tae2 family protein